MPIAIFSLNKLSVATFRFSGHSVSQLANRWLRDVRLTLDPDGTEVITLCFTSISRRRGLLIHDDEVWQFRKGVFTIIHRQLRNGRLVREFTQSVPPLVNTFWCQANASDWITQKLEQGQTARCIIEQYLYEHVPDPEAYRVTSFDFNRLKGNSPWANNILDPTKESLYTTFSIRPKKVVMEEAFNDRSENSEVWMQIFESTILR